MHVYMLLTHADSSFLALFAVFYLVTLVVAYYVLWGPEMPETGIK